MNESNQFQSQKPEGVVMQAPPLTPAVRPTPAMEILNRIQATRIADPEIVKQGMKAIFQTYKRVRPGFSSSWVIPNPPQDAELITEYMIEDTKVSFYKLPRSTECLYHVTPFEYNLPEEEKKIIELARRELLEHYPKGQQSVSSDLAREYARKQSVRILYKLSRLQGLVLGRTRAEEFERVKKLAEILTKYTAGFGIMETLLRDKHIQDIYIDAPVHESPVYVIIAAADIDKRLTAKCMTNILLTGSDAESIVSRLRYESGRPFSEATPILETNVHIHRTRATVIGSPLSPGGLSITLRRHATEPWTLLRLINEQSLTPLAAGLLSFLIDGNATILVAGPRGAGKTAMLGALLFEFPQSQRIVTIEDTLELPCEALKSAGYKIQSMHVQSPLGGFGEMSVNDALRISLRLGESALVIGEVRGEEAKTLYEAMRAGTAGSSVLGTIHANSAIAVYERVVYDLGIPPKSFSATDIIVVTGYFRPSGVHELIRRTLEITEVQKGSGLHKFQLKEHLSGTRGPRAIPTEDLTFQNLMTYDKDRDALLPTEVFSTTSEIIGQIAERWGISMEEAIENITARAEIRGFIVNFAREHNRQDLLGAQWIHKYNNVFWGLLGTAFQTKTKKKINYRKLVEDWENWFRSVV